MCLLIMLEVFLYLQNVATTGISVQSAVISSPRYLNILPTLLMRLHYKVTFLNILF